MPDSDEDLRRLLTDMLALRTAHEMGVFRLPDDHELDPIRVRTSDTADKLLEAHRRSLMIESIKDLIIHDVRAALISRTNAQKRIEVFLGVVGVIMVLLLAAASFLLLSDKNLQAVQVLFWISLALSTLLTIGLFYARFSDDSG